MERLTPGRPRRAKRNPASTQIPFQTPARLAQQHTPRESSLGLLGGLSVVEPLADTPEAPPGFLNTPEGASALIRSQPSIPFHVLYSTMV
jgi:hypothetical protein